MKHALLICPTFAFTLNLKIQNNILPFSQVNQDISLQLKYEAF